jgi:hypothetical protein
MRSSCGISSPSGTRRGAVWRLRRDALIFDDSPGSGQLGWGSCRITDRALARAFGLRLDRQLASGREPESGRLLAARAQYLASRPARRALADDWEYLLHRAKHSPSPSLGRMALRRDLIVAAEPELREMIACLRASLPVPVTGIAAASLLLTDGAGPLHNPRAHLGLLDAVRRAITQLDPCLPLFASL